ncbi:2-amino-4-hydroxy-6-hydroxymethyldihydropteridine diphosphokinase [Sinirhodobacter populi]|uniref:2-amino-4-hydroxy-6-hydroxymethyldihydropteridine pyrophosphokinase n=2 Tax=Paenirhodobacter populi TaxID=2306993 RepID=A0A443JH20_9RHOB|nr:2-amino-4-hydroxy-6-hydroxymethyldihydropteridine diphosphokinase [Sinirhodobacter populi]
MFRDCNMFLIALGANLSSDAGAPAQTLTAALSRLDDDGFTLSAVSRFYRSPAFPAGSGPDYVNACAALKAAPGLTPETVLAALHRVEDGLGRVRTERWQARRIDLDLIAAGDTLLPDAETHRSWRDLPLARQMREVPAMPIVPHPRLQDRAFVLIPLAEIAPHWRHPVIGKTVQEMLDALPEDEKAALTPLSAPFGED